MLLCSFSKSCWCLPTASFHKHDSSSLHDSPEWSPPESTVTAPQLCVADADQRQKRPMLLLPPAAPRAHSSGFSPGTVPGDCLHRSSLSTSHLQLVCFSTGHLSPLLSKTAVWSVWVQPGSLNTDWRQDNVDYQVERHKTASQP